MLKMVPFSPAQPRRAKARLSAGFVLGSTNPQRTPLGKELYWELRVGWVEISRLPVFVSPAALLDDHFEHPTCLHEL
jgi:hypothetical protein